LDPAADVAATAIVSLAAIDSSVTPDFLQEQMNRGSWYDELRIASLVAMKKLARQEFVPLIKSCSSLRYTMAVREEVMNAWVRCAPDDPELHEVLLSSAHHEVSRLRELAITLLSDLKIEAALPLLETLAHTDGDGDIRKMATDAIDEIRRVSLKK
jgi:HEAT repeat protein